MRRGLALFLSVVMLFSFIPNRVEGNSYVKDIDVVFGKFQLKVDNKKVVNHKEPFLYDDDLYLGLTDLARGLEMAINVNGNIVNLSSKGKLNFNNNNSNESIAFQRGYEIMAKERILESLQDEISLLNNQSTGRIDYKMKANVKSIRVGFGRISVYLDGKKINLDSQPLKYNNDIYIPLDSISPYLYITPSMSKDKTTINIDANGILVKNNIYSTVANLLNFREGRNYLLDLQRAELERKKSFMEEFKLPYKKISTITALEKYLNDTFGKLGELDLNIKLAKQSNWINLDISFPGSKNFLWYKLMRSDVEAWIWNIYTAINNLYDDEALVSGVVSNPYFTKYSNSSLKNYLSFYTKDNDIYFDFTKSRLGLDDGIDPNYLLEVLNTNLTNYSIFSFTYEAKMSGNDMEIVVHPNFDSFNQMSLYTKMGYLKLLNDRIKDLYPDIAVNGKIVYSDEKILPLNFYINENRIRSADLMNETIDYLNNIYGHFYHGSNAFKLDYSIYEKDLKNFDLFVMSDFFLTDTKWVNTGVGGENALSSVIHNALSFVVSLWDANVFTEVVDKEGNPIKEFDIFQETVSMVSANPISGQIVEGTRVRLSTDTPGTKIYYTTDGSTPTVYSNLYSNIGIEITRNMVINAFGYKDGFGAGPVSTFSYTVVKDDGLSDGLNSLAINPGILTPGFTQNNHGYAVNVDGNVETINITPTANKGIIKINGIVVNSGQISSITLNDGANTITIGVKEDNKKERIYTVAVNKDSSGTTHYNIAELKFNTLFGLIFSGKITSNNVSDFSGYKVEILNRSDKPIKVVNASGDGEFNFIEEPLIEISPIDKIIGFKYRIYNGAVGVDNMVLERNLP